MFIGMTSLILVCVPDICTAADPNPMAATMPIQNLQSSVSFIFFFPLVRYSFPSDHCSFIGRCRVPISTSLRIFPCSAIRALFSVIYWDI